MNQFIYFKAKTEFLIGQGVTYSEFCGDVATRQINITKDGSKFSISSSITDWDEEFGHLLYDGRKEDLDLTESIQIESKEFEQLWSFYNQLVPVNILYSDGDASISNQDNIVIAHIVNNLGYWAKGFVNSLSKIYPTAKDQYQAWFRKEKDLPFQLGKVQFVEVDSKRKITVANMLAQDGVKKSLMDKNVYVDYDALEKCLLELALFSIIHRSRVQMPKIGSGLGGGSWTEIESLITKTLLYYRVKVEVKNFS